MVANKAKLNDLIKKNDIQFVIPVYQRNYDWTMKECKVLLNDIKDAGKLNREHFIGSIVYVDDHAPKTGIQELIIVDGQQRLTTIILIYLRLYKLAEELKDNRLRDRMYEHYLINKYANTEEEKSAAIKKATNVLKTVQRFGDDNQKSSAVDGTTSATDNAEVLKSTFDLGNSINDKDLQLEAHKAIAAKRVADVNVYAVRNLQHSHTDNQVPALELYTENCPEAIEVSAKEGIYVTLDSKNQIKAKSLIDKRVDENFEGQEKIDLLNKSNDFICEADVENQLALHEMAMNSKYDEVVEHASSNIYTYDESVQADAIKASYNTGNQKAIDAVNAQLDKCSQKAVEAVGSDVISRQTQATESRYTKEVAQQVAEFNQKYQELTGTAAQDNILPDADEQKMAFVQNFLSATPQEQYKLLSKIPQAWQGTVFSKICQYCPTLLTGLVKQGYGKQILKTPGMPSDVIYKVINTMLTCGAKDKKDASKYVLDHKYLFTESTLERCEEILNGVKGRERKNYSSKPIGGGIQAALQPGMSAIYPDKMDMFYKA